MTRKRGEWLECYIFVLSEDNYSYPVIRNHFSGEKWKQIVTTDETWIYLNDCNKKDRLINGK